MVIITMTYLNDVNNLYITICYSNVNNYGILQSAALLILLIILLVQGQFCASAYLLLALICNTFL